MAILPIPPSGVAFIDPITGGVSVQWQNYLLSLTTLSGGFAPLDAEYWVSTANSTLTNETNLGGLTSGYLKLTVAAAVGTPSTVTSIPGSDVSGAALTKTNDTNVTLTLGGTPTTALLRAVSLTLGWTGTLAHGRGGTDVTSPGAAGNLLTSDGTNWTSAAPATSGTVTHTGTLTATDLVIGNGGADVTVDSHWTIDQTSHTLSSTTQTRCVAFNSGTQSINDSTYTAVTLDSEDVDVGGMHDTATNNSRLTVPASSGGFYLIFGQICFAANTTGVRTIRLTKNGSTDLAYSQPGTVATGGFITITNLVFGGVLAAGDYIELYAQQTSGGALNIGNATRGLANAFTAAKLW